MNVCPSCRTTLASDADVCASCGHWLEGTPPACDVHPDVPATICCTICGRPACAECAVQEGRAMFCNTPGHRTYARDWVLLEESTSVFEADWIVTNLSQIDIAASLHSAYDFSSTRWNPLRRPARVYVAASRLAAAREALTRFHLDGTNGKGDAA